MSQTYDLENGTSKTNGDSHHEHDQSEIELRKIELVNSMSDGENGEHDKFINSSTVPFDKGNLVYIIFLIHGIGVLMPWNMFITAGHYYTNFKMNVSLTDPVQNETLSNYREKFESIASISSQIPNLIFNGLNLFLAYYSGSVVLNLLKLISSSIIVNIIVLSITCLLAVVNTDTWVLTFFYITVISIIVLNISNGFYQNSMYGAAAKLPREYTNAVIFGHNICGTIVSSVSIFTIFISPDLQTAGFLYFFSAIIILIACLITFRLLMGNDFYQFYANVEKETASGGEPAKPSYMYILKHCGEQCLNVFLTFFVTLALFPAVLSRINQTGTTFSPIYFTPIFCFLNFNFFAMIGNILPSYFIYPSPKRLWIPVCLRLLFIPFFLFCNFKPATYHVYFAHDAFFIVGTLLVGITHGYLSSLGMMYASKSVSAEHAPIAGMLSAFCLICGISSGVIASLIF